MFILMNKYCSCLSILTVWQVKMNQIHNFKTAYNLYSITPFLISFWKFKIPFINSVFILALASIWNNLFNFHFFKIWGFHLWVLYYFILTTFLPLYHSLLLHLPLTFTFSLCHTYVCVRMCMYACMCLGLTTLNEIMPQGAFNLKKLMFLKIFLFLFYVHAVLCLYVYLWTMCVPGPWMLEEPSLKNWSYSC